MTLPCIVIEGHSHSQVPFGQATPHAEPAPIWSSPLPGAPLYKPGKTARTKPERSVEAALYSMDEYGIAACVLSVPAVVNHRSKESARDAARRTNELFVETVASHPNRFSAIATVPGRDVDAVLAESQYALDTLKCDGVATSTSIGAAYLGEPQFDPWLEELDHRGATLVFHPSVSAAEQQSALAGLHESVIEFLFEMTRLVTNMVVTGAKRRFANINMIASQRTSSRQPNSGASATRLHLERRSARPVKFPFTPP